MSGSPIHLTGRTEEVADGREEKLVRASGAQWFGVTSNEATAAFNELGWLGGKLIWVVGSRYTRSADGHGAPATPSIFSISSTRALFYVLQVDCPRAKKGAAVLLIDPHGIAYNSARSYTSPPTIFVLMGPGRFRRTSLLDLIFILLTRTLTPLNLQRMTTMSGSITEVIRMRMSDWTSEECFPTDTWKVPVCSGKGKDCCPYDDCVVHG
jgi:hypothetical protein